MRAWWTTACYELLKYSRMRSVLILLIGLPLLLILLLGSAFDTEIKPAKVVIHNADQGMMRASTDLFWSDDAIEPYIDVLLASSEIEVQQMVREGTADYGIVIPVDFSTKLSIGETTNWYTFSGRYQEKNIAAEAVVNSFMAQINVQLAALTVLGPDHASNTEGQASVASELFTSGDYSLIVVGTLAGGENKVFGQSSAMQYYASAYLIMFLLYGGMTAAVALLTQKTNGTLQRIYAIPSSYHGKVLGIITGALMLAAIQAIIIVAFTSGVYGVDWGGHYSWISLICILTSIAGAGLAIIIASFARTIKSTQSLVSIIIFTMTILSGGMMAGLQNLVGDVDKFTINHWGNASLRAIMNGTDVTTVWNDIAVLALVAAILAVIAIIRLPKVVKQHA